MKTVCYLLILLFSITSCKKDTIIIESDPEHFTLEETIDLLPFDQFNNNSKAIFRNTQGDKYEFSLSISEEIIENTLNGEIYSTDKVTFVYSTPINFEIPNFIIEAAVEHIPDIGHTEIINCDSNTFSVDLIDSHLTIIPGQDYKNTVLNREFSWMGEPFTDVYSNILIQENGMENVKLFYSTSMGIIGFVDNTNKSWILDGFE